MQLEATAEPQNVNPLLADETLTVAGDGFVNRRARTLVSRGAQAQGPAYAIGFKSRSQGRPRRATKMVSPRGARRRAVWLVSVLGVLALQMAAVPVVARAHGPVAPVASAYLAKVSHTPPGLEAEVVDGYLRLWLRTRPGADVEILDYLGAPYLRFSHNGVYVNKNSEMYYLNHVTPLPIPSGLTRNTPPKWLRISAGHEYEWHDGRIGGLTDTAVAPGVTYVGKWMIAVVVNGQQETISGGLWHSGAPSIVWFWPIVVILACLLAAWRLRRSELDATILRALALVGALAAAIGDAGKELHGRPFVGTGQLVLLALVLAFLAGAVVRVLRGRHGLILLFAIWFVALLVGAELLPILLEPFVLMSLPAFVARVMAVLCLGCAAGMLLFLVRFPSRELN